MIQPIPMLTDNYCWLLSMPDRNDALLVDPSESDKAIQALEHAGRTLAGILITHHHADHVGGVQGIVDRLGPLPVVCSLYDHRHNRVPCATTEVGEGDIIEMAGMTFSICDVPGHTLGAIAYYNADANAAFTGDTLFLAGCGRLFEGTPAMMHASLQKLAALPPETLIYCGHEYTARNLRFAISIDPENIAIQNRIEKLPSDNIPTVPATLATELATNPFLRVETPSLRTFTHCDDPVGVFTALREARNRY